MATSPADEPAPWEPVITRPDPMTAEEWEILLERDLAEDLDPGELGWEDDFLDPDADLTGAELAETAAAMQARAADAAASAGQAAASGPGSSPSTARNSSSNSTPSVPRTATTGSRPAATTPAPGSGT